MRKIRIPSVIQCKSSNLPIAKFLLQILVVIQVGKHPSQLRETQIDYKKTGSIHPNTLIKWGKKIDCLGNKTSVQDS